MANNRSNIDVDGCMEIFPNGDARLRHEEGYKRMKAIFEKGFIKVIVGYTSSGVSELYDVVDFDNSVNFQIKKTDNSQAVHPKEMEFDRYELSVNNMIAKNDSSVNIEFMQDSQNNSEIKNPSKPKMMLRRRLTGIMPRR